MNTATASRPITQAELEETLGKIRVPACPAAVTEIMHEVDKEEPQLKVLARIIASDVGMSAMAVKLANSPIFNAGNKAKSVQQAVNRLGTGNIRSVAIAVALRNTASDLPVEMMEKFWARASTLALATGLLARKHVGISPEAAYTYALFHDAAIPVMMLNFPEYAAVCADAGECGDHLVEQERELCQCDHAVVGWLLARNWGLPARIASAIRYHHDPELYILPEQELPPDALALIAVTLIAEHVIADFIEGASPVEGRSLENARTFLGTSETDLDEFRDIIAHALG